MKKKEKTPYRSRQKLPETAPEYKFGTRLKKEMAKKGMTQAALARMMGVTEGTVADWCQHYTFPSDLNLGELCRIFAPCSIDYFHGNIDEPSYDVKFIMEYTGLSSDAVESLHKLKYAIDFDNREREREEALYQEELKKNPMSGGYTFSSNPDEIIARDRAKRIVQLLNTMLCEDELLSLMSIYVSGDIQNIAYYNSSKELKQDFLSGYLLAFDSMQGYRMRTSSLIRPHLADRIIDCLKKYAKENNNNENVHLIRPNVVDDSIIDI